MSDIRKILNMVCFLSLSWIVMFEVVKPTIEKYTDLQPYIDYFPYTYIVGVIVSTSIMYVFVEQARVARFSKIFLYCAGFLYAFVLFVFLFVKTPNIQDYNFNPFDFFQLKYKVLTQAALNVISFVPLGWVYGKTLSKRQMVIVATILSVSVEGIQFLYHLGVLAVSDVMLNVLGSWVGWYWLKEYEKRKGSLGFF